MELAERAEQLAADLIAPMLSGGQVKLQRPFGTTLAELGAGRQVVDNDLKSRIDNARLRQARAVVAVDVLPPLSNTEWALCGCLNDLLQATNHELSSFLTRGRHLQLLEATDAAITALPNPKTLEQVVCRYATFSRALALVRLDTTVHWWSGSQSFRGQPAPQRLLAWPGLRRVQVSHEQVTLCDMDDGLPQLGETFDGVLNHWLQRSPLVDLAHAARPAARFAWSPATLGLTSSVAGCNLALRAIRAQDQVAEVTHALASAAATLSTAQRRWPDYLLQQLRQSWQEFLPSPSG